MRNILHKNVRDYTPTNILDSTQEYLVVQTMLVVLGQLNYYR